MNSFLLSLGIAIALLLIAAFTAPFFIDWSSYRDYFEARAGEIISRPVVFDGSLTVRLVPYPSLVADEVRIGGPNSGEGIDRIEMRAALSPLLSGELQVTEFTLTRPDVILRLDREGRIDWADSSALGTPLNPDRIVVDRVEIVDGSFTVEDERSGDIRYLEGVNLEGSASSLLGPFKIEGGGVLDGERYTVRLATGRAAEDGSGMRVKLSVLPAARPLAIALDGALLRIDGMPVFDGRLIVEKVVADAEEEESAPTWRLDGQLTASPESLVLDKMSIRFGTEVRNVSLSGAANVRLGADPRFDAVVSARQIDFDRTFGSGPDSPVSPQAALAQIGAMLDAEIFPLPGHLALDVESIVLSGGLLNDLSVDLNVDDGIWSLDRATVTAPGGTTLGVAGTIGLAGASPHFDGAARLHTDQATVFTNWMFGAQARLPRFAIPAGQMRASGQIRIDETGLGLERVEVRTGDTAIDGSLAYRPSREGERGAVALALTADRLAFSDDDGGLTGRASLLGGLERLLAGLDLDLQVQTGALSLGAVEARDFAVSTTIADGDVRIDELRVGDIGGARISGSGNVRSYARAPEGNLRLDVSADSVDGVVEALDAFGAPLLARHLADRAGDLVPADLSTDVQATTQADGSQGTLELTGTLGGTAVDGRFGFDGRLGDLDTSTIDVAVRADNADGGQLAAQLGLAPPPGAGGQGRLAVSAQGRPRDAVRFTVEAAGVGADGTLSGSARWPQGGGREVTADLDARLSDTEALLALAGIAVPTVDATELSVAGSVSGTDDIWRLSNLVIGDGESVARGELTFDVGGAEKIVGGSLEADRMELAWLMETLLGPQATSFPEAGSGETAWPSDALAPIEKTDWRGRIGLTTPAFGLFGGLVLTEAQTAFTFDGTRMSLEDLRGNLFGGRMAGGIDLVDAGGVVDLSGRVDLADARLEDFVWHDNSRAVATGAVSAGMEFTGRGRSLAAIASSLSGTGSFRVENGVLRRFNPNAFDQIVSAADAGLELTEEKVREAFAGHLDAGSLRFQSMEGAFAISSGVLRASNIRIDADDLRSFASATVDLSLLALDSEWTLQVTGGDDDGRTREVGVVFAGPIEAPSRQIDVNPLLGFLTVRAFEQEVERLEELQATILERQRLGRELIRQGQERVRREREAERRQNEAAAAEESARRAEEEARRAEEERRAREADQERQAAEEEARRRAEQEALRAAEERAQRQAEEERRRIEPAPASPGSAISVEPLPPPSPLEPQLQSQPLPPAEQQAPDSATTIDNSEFRRRIEDLLRQIPSASEGPMPTGGVMAREAFPEPFNLRPVTEPQNFSEPLDITPPDRQPVPQANVGQPGAGRPLNEAEAQPDTGERTFH
ncbi:AsmA-like C-terminal region-containing protein [Microbaculum marinum]|uniref:AsmA-like C-terminal region-containing protein n=1 Tax=Microbaculum marinum TaxID=1764581 RepID=A0AAW9RQY2_9HYPH